MFLKKKEDKIIKEDIAFCRKTDCKYYSDEHLKFYCLDSTKRGIFLKKRNKQDIVLWEPYIIWCISCKYYKPLDNFVNVYDPDSPN